MSEALQQRRYDAKLSDVVLRQADNRQFYLQGKIWSDKKRRWKDGTVIFTSVLQDWGPADVLNPGMIVQTRNTLYLIEGLRTPRDRNDPGRAYR